ncbi:MAG: hypothetical protein J0L94_11155, partial [Rhodothermia bacterium]|nr:hypothetical protein [Rhodothermia bacterium]MBN8588863.1 hypothetical protein [Rhodothermia bacterium]
FLGRLHNHFFERLTFTHTLKNTPKTTRFALVLRVSRTIRTIFHDMFRTTFMTTFFSITMTSLFLNKIKQNTH